jgi:hypothetical protein
VSEDDERDPNPLVKRVNALMRRQVDAAGGGAVPVLTEVVDPEAGAQGGPGVDEATVEALARMLENAVLERLGPEVDRLIEERLARTLTEVLGRSLESVRAELTVTVTQMVREAVAASVARALSQRKPG